jgi:hypothetical protein
MFTMSLQMRHLFALPGILLRYNNSTEYSIVKSSFFFLSVPFINSNDAHTCFDKCESGDYGAPVGKL